MANKDRRHSLQSQARLPENHAVTEHKKDNKRMQSPKTINTRMIDYKTLRKSVGCLGVGLPFALLIFSGKCLDSISAYHDTRVGPVLAGVLFAVGVYLFAYKGHDWRDEYTGDFAGIAAICVAVFPHDGAFWAQIMHHFAAVLLFLALISFCWLFAESHKQGRNKVYYTCGAVMIVCLVLLIIAKICCLDKRDLPLIGTTIVFWLESFLLWAFGVSWFVKGMR